MYGHIVYDTDWLSWEKCIKNFIAIVDIYFYKKFYDIEINLKENSLSAYTGHWRG